MGHGGQVGGREQLVHQRQDFQSGHSDGNQVEDAQAHEAQAQQGAQAQRITRSMARALGQEYQKMALIL